METIRTPICFFRLSRDGRGGPAIGPRGPLRHAGFGPGVVGVWGGGKLRGKLHGMGTGQDGGGFLGMGGGIDGGPLERADSEFG